MVILGVSAGFHDAAAAVVVDGRVVAAVEQERLTRRKHDASFPDRAMDACLATAGLAPGDVELVVQHERPLGVVDRYLATRVRTGPTALRSTLTEAPAVLRTQMGSPRRITRWFADRGCPAPPVHYVEHHASHAAAAFYPSPFTDAAVLTLDGVGEWATATRGAGHDRHLTLDGELRFPHSLGLLYSAFTEYCGFRPNSGEGELMGLAPYGEPTSVEPILEHLVDLDDDGSFRIDLRYFDFLRGRRLTGRRFHLLFGAPPRPQGSPPTNREADLAASIQAVTELVVGRMARDLRERTGATSLCMSGGVALNCVSNGRLLRENVFEDIWVPPAVGDSGAAVGAALWAEHRILGRPRTVDKDDGMSGALLGPSFSNDEVREWLDGERIEHVVVEHRDELCRRVAARLADGAVVGWFRGRMEFGPRALGSRSILADARSATVQARINAMVKERADFRPFAPAVLSEHASAWFDLDAESPYMNFVVGLLPEHRTPGGDEPGAPRSTPSERVAGVRSCVPAVTHVDHSARVQTVDDRRAPDLTALLRAFHDLTGCPMVLNTSFNARDEPIVCTPRDAYLTFRRTGLDVLVLQDCLVEVRS